MLVCRALPLQFFYFIIPLVLIIYTLFQLINISFYSLHFRLLCRPPSVCISAYRLNLVCSHFRLQLTTTSPRYSATAAYYNVILRLDPSHDTPNSISGLAALGNVCVAHRPLYCNILQYYCSLNFTILLQ